MRQEKDGTDIFFSNISMMGVPGTVYETEAGELDMQALELTGFKSERPGFQSPRRQ